MLLILDILVLWVFFLHIEVKGIICNIILAKVVNQRLIKNCSIIDLPHL